LGGVSRGAYDSLNLGLHVDDDFECVKKNRQMIAELLPAIPRWLDQVHGVNISTSEHPLLQADGAVTHLPSDILTIMTADCMPILFCDQAGDILGACHGGWRGLSAGIIARCVHMMLDQKKPDSRKNYLQNLRVYLGPTIGPKNFEVGDDVVEAFLKEDDVPGIRDCFSPLATEGSKYLMDLFQVARLQCQFLGIERVYTEEICSYDTPNFFFSHRRDRKTGRFASFLWKSSQG
jgi:YfiH family protein